MPVAGWYVLLFPRDFLLGGDFFGLPGKGKEFSELVTQGKGKKETQTQTQTQKPNPSQAKPSQGKKANGFFFCCCLAICDLPKMDFWHPKKRKKSYNNPNTKKLCDKKKKH